PPARRKKAEAKPSQRGPADRAREENAAARATKTSPLHSQAREACTDLSRLPSACNARTGSMRAAARAGNQAEMITDIKPIPQASKSISASTATWRTLTSTYNDEMVSATA